MSLQKIVIKNIIVLLVSLILPVTSVYAVEESDPIAIHTALSQILDAQMEAAIMIGSTDTQETIALTQEQLDQLTLEDLQIFEGLEGPLSDLLVKQNELNIHVKDLEEIMPNLGEIMEQTSRFSSTFLKGGLTDELEGSDYIGLTNAGYGALCSENPFGSPPNGPNRSGGAFADATVIAITVSDIALDVADLVKDIADLACKETLVILGQGGNASLACLPFEIIHHTLKKINVALKTTRTLVTFCDASINSAEIEGSYERLADIYDQNMAHDANIDADLVAHDANIDADLVAHDIDIKARLDEIQAKVDQAIQLLLTPKGIRAGFPTN